MMDLFINLKWWHWWIAAAVLAAVETFMPGAVAIWFSASALVVGALLLVLPIPWQLQLVLFGVLGFVAIAAYRIYLRKHPEQWDQPTLNQRGAQYIGRTLTLVEAIDQGFGRARIGDSVWKVAGPDLPAGASVRVTGMDGAVLIVEAAAATEK